MHGSVQVIAKRGESAAHAFQRVRARHKHDGVYAVVNGASDEGFNAILAAMSGRQGTLTGNIGSAVGSFAVPVFESIKGAVAKLPPGALIQLLSLAGSILLRYLPVLALDKTPEQRERYLDEMGLDKFIAGDIHYFKLGKIFKGAGKLLGKVAPIAGPLLTATGFGAPLGAALTVGGGMLGAASAKKKKRKMLGQAMQSASATGPGSAAPQATGVNAPSNLSEVRQLLEQLAAEEEEYEEENEDIPETMAENQNQVDADGFSLDGPDYRLDRCCNACSHQERKRSRRRVKRNLRRRYLDYQSSVLATDALLAYDSERSVPYEVLLADYNRRADANGWPYPDEVLADLIEYTRPADNTPSLAVVEDSGCCKLCKPGAFTDACCKACVHNDEFDGDQFVKRNNLPAGNFFRSSWVDATLADLPDGLFGQIDTSSRPFKVLINRHVQTPRAQLAFAHEGMHMVDSLLKLGLSHDKVHSLATMLVSEVLPGLNALSGQ